MLLSLKNFFLTSLGLFQAYLMGGGGIKDHKIFL
jgi:hypothetical protein